MWDKIWIWLNASERWHDLAHLLFGYLIVSLIGHFTAWYIGLSILCIYCAVKEYLDGYAGFDTWHDISQYLIGAILAILMLVL